MTHRLNMSMFRLEEQQYRGTATTSMETPQPLAQTQDLLAASTSQQQQAKADIVRALPILEKGTLKRGPKLGSGVYGVVHVGFLTLAGGRTIEVAMKQFSDYDFSHQQFLQEARLLLALRGEPCVPWLYGVVEGPCPIIAMSMCPGTPLNDLLELGYHRICLFAFRALFMILCRLHARGITHGDIHAGNVMVDTSEDGDAADVTAVSLIDFGFGQLESSRETVAKDLKRLEELGQEIVSDGGGLSELGRRLLPRASAKTREAGAGGAEASEAKASGPRTTRSRASEPEPAGSGSDGPGPGGSRATRGCAATSLPVTTEE